MKILNKIKKKRYHGDLLKELYGININKEKDKNKNKELDQDLIYFLLDKLKESYLKIKIKIILF